MFLLLALVALFTPQDLIKNSPGISEYPDAGAIILLDRETMAVEENGSITKFRYLLIKILNDRGISEYGDIKQRYDKNTQRVEIVCARTHLPNGEVVKVEKKAITDLSAEETYRAPTYTNVRLKLVSFPGLESNAVIEYECKITSKGGKEPFFGEVVFGAKEPILSKEFTLTVPDNRHFKYKVVNGEVKPEIMPGKRGITYRFGCKNIPAIVEEPDMPPLAAICPRLLFSSLSSWKEVGKWVSDKFYSSVDVSKEIRHKTEELIADGDTIKNCFLWVTTKIRNVNLPLGICGYKPNKASRVYKNRYGDSRDKAALLISMLKEIGRDAFPVLINRKGIQIVREIPSPSQFDFLIVGVKEESAFRFFDPLARACRFGWLPPEDNGDGLIIFHKDCEFKEIYAPPPDKSQSKSILKLRISQDGSLNGVIQSNLTGFYDQIARRTLKDKKEKERKLWFEENANTISNNTKLLSSSVSDIDNLLGPLSINVSFESNRFIDTKESEVQFVIPWNPFNFASLSKYIAKSERKYPLLIRAPRIVSYETEIEIPPDFNVEYLPEAINKENKFVRMHIESEVKARKIVYHSKIKLKRKRIEPNEYPEFRPIIAKFLKSRMRVVMLKKG
jgi:hypothetical protein